MTIELIKQRVGDIDCDCYECNQYHYQIVDTSSLTNDSSILLSKQEMQHLFDQLREEIYHPKQISALDKEQEQYLLDPKDKPTTWCEEPGCFRNKLLDENEKYCALCKKKQVKKIANATCKVHHCYNPPEFPDILYCTHHKQIKEKIDMISLVNEHLD